MIFQTALLCAAALQLALAHPHAGVPKLMGWRGALDFRGSLEKRVKSPDGTCGATSAGLYMCGTGVDKCCSQSGE